MIPVVAYLSYMGLDNGDVKVLQRECVCVDSKFVFVPFGYSVCIGIQLYGRTHTIKLRIVSINAARCGISGEAAARLQWTRTLYGAVCTRGKKSVRTESGVGLSIFPSRESTIRIIITKRLKG